MRSTKASSAVERLNKRSNHVYSMLSRSDGRFALLMTAPTGDPEPIGAPLPMNEFLLFVNGIEPAAPKRLSKLDVAFREQLKKK